MLHQKEPLKPRPPPRDEGVYRGSLSHRVSQAECLNVLEELQHTLINNSADVERQRLHIAPRRSHADRKGTACPQKAAKAEEPSDLQWSATIREQVDTKALVNLLPLPSQRAHR